MLNQLNPIDHPLPLFQEWFSTAKREEIVDASAMALATATLTGQPSVRMVLLKSCDKNGFTFFTNLTSRKAQELQQNPQAALCFYWPKTGRQVRIEGKIVMVSNQEADTYFSSRPRGSQIGAWASQQSQPLANPQILQAQVQQFTEKFHNKAIPRPEFWSGYRLIPEKIEFWQQGEDRLHERVCYQKISEDQWQWHYLYP